MTFLFIAAFGITIFCFLDSLGAVLFEEDDR